VLKLDGTKMVGGISQKEQTVTSILNGDFKKVAFLKSPLSFMMHVVASSRPTLNASICLCTGQRA
jgi:hypothetical protein